MKRSIWTRAMAMFLVACMVTTPASAASYGRSRWGNWGSFWNNIWGSSSQSSNQNTTTPDSSETVMTLVEGASTVDNGELLRAETYALTTTDEAAAEASDETAAETTVKYFPVTMYNYAQSTINAATDKLDDDLSLREGIYFSNGGSEVPYTTTTETDLSAFVAGQYYIQNIRAAANGVGSWLYVYPDDYSIRSTADQSKATLWNLVIEDGKYYLTEATNGDYLFVGNNGQGTDDCVTMTKTAIDITAFSGDSRGVQLSQNGYYLCQWGSATSIYYGGYNVANDGGNGMLFYPVVDGVASNTPIAPGEGEATYATGYEKWNRWDKASGGSAAGDLIYTGLVKENMVDDQPVFNVPEGGIFNNDTTVKDIYEYVGLPFVLNKETGVYSFDSDVNGAYFSGTPQSGTIDESGNITAHNLYFAEGVPQLMFERVGDGSTNGWFPYNTTHYETYVDSYDGKTYGRYTSIDHHFGMRADLPFSMTPNGRIKSTDDESTPITFTFSGDDDVWVFIDGHLVIDLGGIHNRLDATINFAENTITYSEENGADTNTTTASYNDPDFAMTQQLFTKDGVEGVIPQSREAFALDPDHEMQVFYLERGEGTSNCRIEFNLPMNDTVLVTKDATQSYSENNKNDADGGVDQLTAAEQAIVNNIDFGFTLYKKGSEEDATFAPVANTNFYLVGRGVEGVVINQTDANGHFYLKNGQSAKFITEIPQDGVTYYVVEDQVPDGFVSPDFNYAGEATYDYEYTGTSDNDGDGTAETVKGTASGKEDDQIPEQIIPMPKKDSEGNVISWPENKSYEVTVKGSIEANDSIEFICSNYLDAELPNPTALAYEDIIVIDYGLPVNIDPLANDVFRGDDIEIVYFGDDSVTLTETEGEDGVIQGSWTGEKNFEFGTVAQNDVTYAVDDKGDITRDTFTYTLTEQLTEVEVLTYIIKVTGEEKQEATGETLTQYDYAIGKVYIVPATVMYYEENFSDLVTFQGQTGKGVWESGVIEESEYVDSYQEPGVVGTTTDSIYGSDKAYLNDSHDSNGTSRKGDTTNGPIRFYYTFTGTGTSFFARTSADTGYMQVKLFEGETISGDYINLTYRDTYYEDTNDSAEDSDGTLYNIPVYTESGLAYGTYTVLVTIAQKGTAAAGGEDGSGHLFYLDGIRVMQPLNQVISTDENGNKVYDEDGNPVYTAITTKALGAYATDGESNIDVVTLRQKLITDNESTPEEGEEEAEWPFAVLTDTNGEIIYASDYVSIGPKEEVYLKPGQSVTFAIKHWHTDGYRMHMGMKAPFGSANVKVGQTTFDLKNAADCYYDITGNHASVVTEKDENGDYFVATYTFTATDSIVSLTNIKIVGNYEFEILESPEINGDIQA